jgi:peroxiredoxin
MKKTIVFIAVCIWLCSSAAPGVYAQDEPDFTRADLSGKEYKLSSYRDKQPVLLFFWTTWCPFCLSKLQELNKGYTALEENGVALLAINAGERRTAVERLVRNYAIKYTVLVDEEGEVSDMFEVLGVPTFVLLDSKGRIQYKGNEYPKAQIQRLIGKK